MMMKILKAGKIAAIRTFQSTTMKVNRNRRTVQLSSVKHFLGYIIEFSFTVLSEFSRKLATPSEPFTP